MTAKWNVTFAVITPESAEQGDVEDRGFTAEGVTLREAIRAVGYHPYPTRRNPLWLEDGGRGFSTTDPTRTGDAETYYSVHPPEGITPSSYRRVARLLAGVRRG